MNENEQNNQPPNENTNEEQSSSDPGQHEPELLLEVEDDNESSTPEPTPVGTPVAPTPVEPVAPAPEAPTPMTTPTPVAASTAVAQPVHPSAGVVILGWLTYAFWGWLILALTWLIYVVLAVAIANLDAQYVIPYALAATLVLLPIAFFTDFFYRKHEPQKKTGAAMVIMVIHAVIFALFGIAALVTTVFIGISLGLSTTSGDGSQQYDVVGILTGLAATILYAAAFLRTLNPFKTNKLTLIYRFVMLGISVVILGLGIAGPVLKTLSLRDDQRIEQHLSGVQEAISDYVSIHPSALPNDLKTIPYTDADAKQLVTDGLVTYKKVDQSPTSDVTVTSLADEEDAVNDGSTVPEMRYQLCVTYKAASSDTTDTYDYSDLNSGVDGDYSTYLSNYTHPAGYVCYDLET